MARKKTQPKDKNRFVALNYYAETFISAATIAELETLVNHAIDTGDWDPQESVGLEVFDREGCKMLQFETKTRIEVHGA